MIPGAIWEARLAAMEDPGLVVFCAVLAAGGAMLLLRRTVRRRIRETADR